MATPSFPYLIQALLSVILVGTASATTGVVKPTCTISWDESPDSLGVIEYRLTVWMADRADSMKATHIVKAPKTQITCREVGASKPGSWQATIQACLNNGICSAPSEPISFKVIK